jgi:exopolysaccharide biosynthesis polyprenyl glycosylphosphotransferase
MPAHDSFEFPLEPFSSTSPVVDQLARRVVALAAKRSFDFALALAGLIFLIPLLVVVAAAIRLETKGPVLFRQRRGGMNGEAFRILKFRTMTVIEDGADVRQAARGDGRVTRVGALLRRTSIDELPQLLNVLTGDMSFVGPRPHAVAHDQHYGRLVVRYADRHRMKPGITGLAQINGARGETPTINHMRRRIDLDLWYVDHWSLALDFKILFHTVGEIAQPGDVY